MKRTLLFFTLLCLLLALCGCDMTPERGLSATTAPTEPPGPIQTAFHLELDGTETGFVFERNNVSYVDTNALRAAWSLDSVEENGTLRLSLHDVTLTLQDGSSEALRADGSRIALDAPVLRGPDGWYLPATALESVFGRTLVRDTKENVLRCLHVENGPELWFNGSNAGLSCRCNGMPALTAAQLTAISGGSATVGEDPDGTPSLTLRAWDQTLMLRLGSLRAELDGAERMLPVPAWQAGEDWYLPLSAVEALGCTVTEDEAAGRISLLQSEEGPSCWFAGLGLGPTRRFGEVFCVDAAALAEAAGGSLAQQGDALLLRAWDHSLRLFPNETRAELDGAALTLPFPLVQDGDRWLLPLEPVAEALGLSALTEDAGLVCSRVEPCETVLWLDGKQLQSYTCPDGGLYVQINEASAQIGGSLQVTENDAVLQTQKGELALRAGAVRCTAFGETLPLSAPTLADGEEWYVSAPEFLPALGFSELIDPELDQRYYTRIAKNDEIPTGYRVPVLMYHAVSDYTWGIPELFVSPSKLEEQIQAMLDGGYTAITFEDLNRIDEIEKPVMLTFDDGYDDNYTELFPLLQKYNVKATVFVIVNDIGKNHKLTEEQIREMSDSGLVSIQSHTMSHEFLTSMYEDQLRHEHYDSMIALARLTGKQPFVMCYPTGKNAAYTRAITAEYYQFGLNMSGPCYVTGEAPYQINRYYITRYTDVETFLADLAG